MRGKPRISKKHLEIMASNVNKLTKHKVELFFGVGCYVTIDGKEYSHYRKKDDSYEGLKNKEVAQLLRQFDDEINAEARRRGWIK